MHLILDWQTGACSVKCHKAVGWKKCQSYEEMPADWGFISLEMTQLQEDLRALSQHLQGGCGKAKGRLFTVVHSWRRGCNCHTSKWEDLTAASKELSSRKDKHANRLPKKILVSVCGNFQATTTQNPKQPDLTSQLTLLQAGGWTKDLLVSLSVWVKKDHLFVWRIIFFILALAKQTTCSLVLVL